MSIQFQVVSEKKEAASLNLPLGISTSSTFMIRGNSSHALRIVFPVAVGKELADTSLCDQETWDSVVFCSTTANRNVYIDKQADFPGAIDISFAREPENEIQFIATNLKASGEATGSCICNLLSWRAETEGWGFWETQNAQILLTKVAAKPEIEIGFEVPEKLFCNKEAIIKWSARGAEDCTVSYLQDGIEKVIATGLGPSGELRFVPVQSGDITFRIQAFVRSFPEATVRELTRNVQDWYSMNFIKDPSSGPIVVTGFYAHPGGVLASACDNRASGIFFFRKNNKGSFTRVEVEVPEMDAQLLSSRGLILKDDLWLMGGSSLLHTNFNSAFAKFSLTNNTWEITDGEASYEARSSHSIIAYGENIWIAGGINYGRGKLKDIGFLDKDLNWTTVVSDKSMLRYGMASARIQNTILLYGGYEQTGTDAVFSADFLTRIKMENEQPAVERLPLITPSSPLAFNMGIVSAALVPANSSIYLFTTSKKGSEKNRFELEIFHLLLRDSDAEIRPTGKKFHFNMELSPVAKPVMTGISDNSDTFYLSLLGKADAETLSGCHFSINISATDE